MYLLLQDINLPLFDIQHVLHVSDLPRQRALFISQVLQLLGLFGHELLLLLQAHPQSVYLEQTENKKCRLADTNSNSGTSTATASWSDRLVRERVLLLCTGVLTDT